MPRPRVRFPRVRLPGRRVAGAARRPLPRVPRSWLPGSLTLANMLCGYVAILAAAERRFLAAALFILAAGFFDMLDGRVARLTNTTSAMGEELDSLADAISFAVAPSMLVFHMGLQGLGRWGYAACFLFAACGVIRLARFNTLPADHHFFMGLPIPAAAAAITTPALVMQGEVLPATWIPLQAVQVVGIALLMVSKIRFRTFKDVDFGGHPYRSLAVLALILAGLLAKYEWMLPTLVGGYVLSPLLFRLGQAFGGGRAAAGSHAGHAARAGHDEARDGDEP